MLRAGESSDVTMPLRLLPDLAIWSVEVRQFARAHTVFREFNLFDAMLTKQTHAFAQVAGTFIIEACSSSAVCPQSFQLKI